MTKIIKLFIFTILAISISSCEDKVQEFDYVGFDAQAQTFGVDIGSTESKDLKIYASKTSSSDRTYTINVDPTSTLDVASYTIATSVTIPANSIEGSYNVTISDMNIDSGEETLVLNLTGDDDTFIGENMTLNVKQICPLNELKLTLAFDGFPEEVAWWITDVDGNVVGASIEPLGFGAYAAGSTGGIESLFCLESGTYTFSIRDSFGDGGGAFSLSLAGTDLFSSDGVYTTGLDQEITLP